MNSRTRQPARLIALLALGALATGCDVAVNGEGGFHFDLAAGKAQDEWTRSYPMAAGSRLELINVNGRIAAEVSDGQAVELRGERTAKAATDDGARSLLGRIEMREEVGDTKVRVEVRPPRTTGPASHEIKWTLKVPRGVSVDLRTVNGVVVLTGLHGEVRARSTNGGITGVALAASSVDASVTNGGVEIELAQAVSTGTFELEAVNGGVTLKLPAESKADIAARCVNGGIAVSGLTVEPRGEQTRRRLDATLNGGGARVTLDTVNGGVRIGPVGSAAAS
ncbi:MAG: hypothetical protein ACT4QD_19330 [Acidobacteriota bacterium]